MGPYDDAESIHRNLSVFPSLVLKMSFKSKKQSILFHSAALCLTLCFWKASYVNGPLKYTSEEAQNTEIQIDT